MPSYLVTIRFEAADAEDAATVARLLVHPMMRTTGRVVSVDAEPPSESVAAVRALSPAVVDELRQMWRADARDEAKLVVREFVPGTYRSRIP